MPSYFYSPFTDTFHPGKPTVVIASWPPATISANTIYQIFDSSNHTMIVYETDKTSNWFRHLDIAGVEDVVTTLFTNAAGNPLVTS